MFASVVATLILALVTPAALVGLGLLAGSLALLTVAGRFPARTGRGSAALARVQGFRLYIATAEAEQLRFQEREKIFTEFLPYAMVFGLTQRWAHVFADLDTSGADPYWYSGAPGWTTSSLVDSVGNFAWITTTTITAHAASSVSATSGTIAPTSSVSGLSGFSSAGFSGGGAGGGGGGSW